MQVNAIMAAATAALATLLCCAYYIVARTCVLQPLLAAGTCRSQVDFTQKPNHKPFRTLFF